MLKIVNSNANHEMEVEFLVSYGAADLWIIPPEPDQEDQIGITFHDLKDAERFFAACLVAIQQVRDFTLQTQASPTPAPGSLPQDPPESTQIDT